MKEYKVLTVSDNNLQVELNNLAADGFKLHTIFLFHKVTEEDKKIYQKSKDTNLLFDKYRIIMEKDI